MSILRLLVLSLAVALPASGFAADRPSPYMPAACVTDLDDLDAFIRANDAGAADALADHGAAIGQAFDKARQAAAQAADMETCGQLLHGYARSWRPGHIAVVPTPGNETRESGQEKAAVAKPAADPKAPRFQVLSKDTILFVIPSFEDAWSAPMRKLVDGQRAVLASHRNWIIDVRNNGGGSDGTYAPLMGYLLDGELRGFRTEYFVTPANIKAQEAICADSSDAARCKERMAPIIARMRAAAPGSFVLSGEKRIATETVKLEAGRPARVALLTDRACGSSCEQFVLEARTSYRVKVVGRPTHGSLDVSNLREHTLPSSRARLYYATTRSTRLPDMRIDTIGVAPDILLPKPQDDAGRAAEVTRVQRWLEGGSLEDK